MERVFECRICGSRDLVVRDYPHGPWIDSLSKMHSSKVSICFCESCNFMFKETSISYDQFYKDEYVIPYISTDDDNVYDIIDGVVQYRTDKQAAIVSAFIDPQRDQVNVLDFGCARAQTAAKLAGNKNLEVSGYDVTNSYKELWSSYPNRVNFSVQDIPCEWLGRFDLVYSFFAFEHIEGLSSAMTEICRVLAPGGKFLLLVPDPLSNFVDIQVLDHINHFSPEALSALFANFGLQVLSIRSDIYKGGLLIIGENHDVAQKKHQVQPKKALLGALRFWDELAEIMLQNEVEGKSVLVHGAGINGLWVLNNLQGSSRCIQVVDNNPSLHGSDFNGYEVQAFEDVALDSFDVIFLAVRPDVQVALINTDYKNHRERIVELFR